MSSEDSTVDSFVQVAEIDWEIATKPSKAATFNSDSNLNENNI